MKYYNLNGKTISAYDNTPKPKAELEDGTIVEYNRCCLAGAEPRLGPNQHAKYLGRGKIYEVEGVKQYYPLSKPQIYDFWMVYE